MAANAALQTAAAAVKAGRTGEVVKPLETALAAEPPGARAAMMHYYLGIAYARTELDKAVAHLQAAIAGDVEQDDARFQLASALDRSGAFARARAEYDRFATAHPQSQLAMFAMRRSATLARLPAVGAPAGPPGGSPEPAAAPPPAGFAPPAVPSAPVVAPPGAPGPAGAAVAAPAAGPAPPAAPRPVRPWPKAWVKPPAKAAGSAAPPSDSPADRAGDPPPASPP